MHARGDRGQVERERASARPVRVHEKHFVRPTRTSASPCSSCVRPSSWSPEDLPRRAPWDSEGRKVKRPSHAPTPCTNAPSRCTRTCSAAPWRWPHRRRGLDRPSAVRQVPAGSGLQGPESVACHHRVTVVRARGKCRKHLGPHRLVWSRTPGFHPGNSGGGPPFHRSLDINRLQVPWNLLQGLGTSCRVSQACHDDARSRSPRTPPAWSPRLHRGRPVRARPHRPDADLPGGCGPRVDPVLSQNSVAPVRPHKSGPGGDSQQRVRARQHWPYGLGLWRLLRMTERLFPLYAAWRW